MNQPLEKPKVCPPEAQCVDHRQNIIFALYLLFSEQGFKTGAKNLQLFLNMPESGRIKPVHDIFSLTEKKKNSKFLHDKHKLHYS